MRFFFLPEVSAILDADVSMASAVRQMTSAGRCGGMTSACTDDDVAGTVAGHMAVTWQEAMQAGDSSADCAGRVTVQGG